MAVDFKWLLTLVAAVLRPVMKAITSKFREEITEWLQGKYEEAKLTDNPWDDYLFEFLAKMLGVTLPV